jgi:hypothetical protein
MNRRDFLSITASCGVAAYINPVFGKSGVSEYIGLHPFIDMHQDAVFIMKTSVDVKTNSVSKQNAGYSFAKQVFTKRDTPGISLADLISIKPNLTYTSGIGNTDDGMGIVTDRCFMEGMINGMIECGFSKDKMYMREGNTLGDGYCYKDYTTTGYAGIAERTGVHLFDLPSGRNTYDVKSADLQSGTEVIWMDVPDGTVFKRIGYLAPFNQENSWLLNVAKFKAHGMGMTLCAKNLQGCCIVPYVRFCDTLDDFAKYTSTVTADFQSGIKDRIDSLYKKHVADGIPRWDRPGDNGAIDFTSGYGMELWAQRTCDSLSVTKTGLSVIEGIYGRNGNGFVNGPGAGGLAEDHMSNIIIFGKNPFLVDIIGIWLSGHEPGNFGFYHIAKERGLLSTLNPSEIPLYEWGAGTPVLSSLNKFTRTELVTTYLRKNYNDGTETEYHLVNEPFNYGVSVFRKKSHVSVKCIGITSVTYGARNVVLEYTLPANSAVSVSVVDIEGKVVAKPYENRQVSGTHVCTWNTSRVPKGTYFVLLQSVFGRAVEKLQLL